MSIEFYQIQPLLEVRGEKRAWLQREFLGGDGSVPYLNYGGGYMNLNIDYNS